MIAERLRPIIDAEHRDARS